MIETCNINGNLANATRDLKQFSGKDPAQFQNWYEKPIISLSISRPVILTVIEGEPRPTEETSAEQAPLARRQPEYDRADHELFAVLSLITEEAASYLMRKGRERPEHVAMARRHGRSCTPSI